jgi:ketosteroid isomerase-like protein
MNDNQQLEALYCRTYDAMIAKDTAELNEVHAPEFVLTHMTGLRQPKDVYIKAIATGILNYYSAHHEAITVTISGDHATLVGQSRVEAAVFGGGKHTWPLQLTFQVEKREGHWLLTSAIASTY